MSGNTFGKIFTLTSFGESHGKAIGGIVDGCPPGIALDLDFIQHELNRRRPGSNPLVTARKEDDIVEILSGEMNGITTGTPIGFLIRNKDHHSKDYQDLQKIYRPSHADYAYTEKYGIRDHRGGGRSSARETISRVVAGSIAKLILQKEGISTLAFTSSIGEINLASDTSQAPEFSKEDIEKSILRCPVPEASSKMEALIQELRQKNDSIGGCITGVIRGVPPGLGSPVFDKLHAQLGQAMLSINAVKGFEYGAGFSGSKQRGSQHNDSFTIDAQGKVATRSNYSGGIQGGISNGQDIYFKVAFKPVPSIGIEQETLQTDGTPTTITIQGRHDPCVVPRAVPIVEAMAAMVIVDNLLLNKTLR